MAHPITGFDNVSNSMPTPFVSFVLFVVNLFRLIHFAGNSALTWRDSSGKSTVTIFQRMS
jgi:hypothetical protein